MFPMSHQRWAVVVKLDVNGTSVHPISQLCIHVNMGVKQCRAIEQHVQNCEHDLAKQLRLLAHVLRLKEFDMTTVGAIATGW